LSSGVAAATSERIGVGMQAPLIADHVPGANVVAVTRFWRGKTRF
jgi:hypothetical protein